MIAHILFGSKREIRSELGQVVNPYSKNIVSTYQKCTQHDTFRALEIAQKASQETKKSLLSNRILWFEDVVKNLEIHKEDMAKTITDEVGKPIIFSRIEVERTIETIKLSIHAMVGLEGHTINTDAMKSGKKTTSYYTRVPVGVICCITPFNFPLNLVAHKIAPALISGNAVVLKPAPEAPLTAYKLVSFFVKSPYAIKDAISLVYGDAEVGSTMISSDIPRMISFTGSMGVGKIISKNAGIKKLALELGGNAGTFIDKTADIAYAAKRCAYGAFVNSGQVCISLQRIYVHRDIYDAFATCLKDETLKLKVGDPYKNNTFIGPLINEDSVQRATSWIKSAIDEGASVLCGNSCDGLNFSPTVMIDVTDNMKIICEEVFAPIVSLVSVENYEEAIRQINRSLYGLQFSIFTNDLSQAKDFIEDADCGGVVINDIPTLRFDIQPYGGTKMSGIGKEGPKFAIEEFTEIKSVVIC